MKKLLTVFFILFQSSYNFGFAQTYVISNVNIVSMENNQVLKNQSIIVDDGKILEIVPMTDPFDFDGNQIIDGKGSYVYPGLAEFHSHIPVAQNGDSQLQEEAMWLYLANGVLHVRGMIGHPSHLDLKARIVNGEIAGPRLFLSGPSFSGGSVSTPEQAAQMVRDEKTAGYDHLKLHPGLSMDEFMAISKTAKELDIPFGGHVSLEVGLEASLKNGYKSIEHMDGYIEAMIPDYSRVLDPEIAGPFTMLLVDEVDLSILPELVDLTLENKVWMAPTLTLFDRFFGWKPAEEYRNAPEMKYMSAQQIQSWINAKTPYEEKGILTEEYVQPYLDFRNKLFMTLHNAGVPMILASDSPQVFNVPGFSIHHEIDLMSKAGMSNFEILKTGSVNAAKYFDQENEWGMIKVGMSADFVLVENNPLEDLNTMKKPVMVVMNGKVYDRIELEKQLNRIEANHKR
ncbi:imidazolonepropionase-like amidohydrolase [Algoriphagus ratkowskyi]|uniref:Amidohydrolase family protein n=1 Tax=Algoriphagus ratkowskyi TaxID=57028 RepID=A0A2W7QY93_9BACT|nr:amidohydrolase family protein [Algoriphagus ratkowskyi]PZX53478.1 imidazolonepropionase-like amidohydrolase [Algoriphagus ratkowskyi]TXD76486.1 amidohydrolase family protein [Algoriphagus ratkowskyi]